jgi:hypothetical protein
METPPTVDETSFQAEITEAGQSLSQQKGLTANEQIAGPSVDPIVGTFIQDLMPLLTNYHSLNMRADFDPFSYVENLATLTQLYLELKMPLKEALRAAEADL